MRSILALLFLAGCAGGGSIGTPSDDDDAVSDDDDAATDDDDATLQNTDPSLWPDTLGGDRSARVKWPGNYDGGALPLVLQLHGYTGSGQWAWQWPDLAEHIDDLGFVLISGEGTSDPANDRFWNATEACCDFYDSNVDDVAWLTSVLDEAEANFPIDPDRIYVTGLSNGGFMSYRLACELSDRVAAIASVAGMDFLADDACVPGDPVSVLHIHGTADQTVAYEGWNQPDWHIPSARDSVERWAERAGCDMDRAEDGAPVNYTNDVSGAETRPESWTAGCAEGHSYALWTMKGAPHVPDFNSDLGADLLGWLLEHQL